MDDTKQLLTPLIISSFLIILINRGDLRIKYSKVVIFCILSANFIFPYYENQNKPALDFVIAECNETLLNDDCKTIYFNEYVFN